jgi:hypothetical protein
VAEYPASLEISNKDKSMIRNNVSDVINNADVYNNSSNDNHKIDVTNDYENDINSKTNNNNDNDNNNNDNSNNIHDNIIQNINNANVDIHNKRILTDEITDKILPAKIKKPKKMNTEIIKSEKKIKKKKIEKKFEKKNSKKFPNILFIMADDLGYGDLSVPPFLSNNYVPKNFPCTEGGILTPNLEKMAKKGMIISNFFTYLHVYLHLNLMDYFHTFVIEYAHLYIYICINTYIHAYIKV